MATLTTGFSWSDGDQVTSARLNATVNSASISGIAQSDFSSGYSVITIGDAAPGSPVEGQAWFDTSPAAEEGVLRVYQGSHWIPVGRGFLGYNTSGSTITVGMTVKRNPAVGGTGNQRDEIAATTSKHDIIAGVAITEATNGSLCIVINNGRVLAVKTTGTIVAGDPVVPSSTTGTATTGADSNYGRFYGAGVAGVFTKSGSGATNEATLFPAAQASGMSFRAPVKLLDASTPATDNTWSGSFGTPQWLTWSATPPGVIARLITFKVIDTEAASDDINIVVGFRQAGSSLTLATGAVRAAGGFTQDNGSSTDSESFDGQLIIPTNPAGDGTDRAEYIIVKDAATAAITSLRITVWEHAVICGGRVV